jgi:hypothetical protein
MKHTTFPALYILAVLILISPATAGFRGAMVYKASDQTIAPGLAGIAPITFDKILYDTCGCWNAESNRFVIPAATRFVRLKAQAIFQHSDHATDLTDSHVRQIVIKKNFNTLENWYGDRPGWAVGQVLTHTATTVDVSASGPVLPVKEGDTFLVDAFVWDGKVSNPVAIRGTNGTWFSIEIVE